jgi:hypothetical protein
MREKLRLLPQSKPGEGALRAKKLWDEMSHLQPFLS